MVSADLFKWSDDYSVHVQEIDEQHKILVGLLNELHVAIIEHHGKNTSRAVLDRLAEYTRTHFLLEESLMRLTHFPGFEVHKQQHEDLISQVQELQKKLDNENVTITFELLHFLKNWLIHHINESDKVLGAHVQNSGLAQFSAWNAEVERTMKKKWWWKFW